MEEMSNKEVVLHVCSDFLHYFVINTMSRRNCSHCKNCKHCSPTHTYLLFGTGGELSGSP